MCRICRARGLGRGARDGGAPPGVAFVDASRPPEDDEIPCGFATADARSDAETSFFGADGDGPPPSPVTRVVVGAGVAGTCCAEELCRLRPRDAVVLVTAGDAVKSVRQVERVTKNVETVHIEEKPATALSHVNLSVVSNAAAVGVDIDKKVLFLEESITHGTNDGCVQRDTKAVKTRGASKRARDGDVENGGAYENKKNKTAPPEKRRRALAYDQLCVCAGAAPRSVFLGNETRSTHDGEKMEKTGSVFDPLPVEKRPLTPESDAAREKKALAASVTIVVRDAESVDALRERTRRARRVLLVGNGAIAMELADALCRDDVARDERSAAKKENGVFLKPSRTETVANRKNDRNRDDRDDRNDRELVWAARHAAIGDAFFDRDAAAFLTDVAEREGLTRASEPLELDVTETSKPTKKPVRSRAGNAAGPDWTRRARAKPPSAKDASGSGSDARFRRFRLRVAPGAELASVVPNDASHEKNHKNHKNHFPDFPATAVLSDGSRFGVDLIVSAAGMDPGPNVAWLPEDRVSRGSDGGVAVDATFRALGDAGAKGLFAAGDAACCDARRLDPSTRWFPMRLWSQARVSGTYAARVMCGEADAQAWGFNYELFAHATRFFGVKVILLGLYNAQKLDAEPASDLVSYSRRDDATNTFARVLLLRGVMVGAALLGDTDLEETFENLILNQTDLTRFGPALLDPETDLGDYFD